MFRKVDASWLIQIPTPLKTSSLPWGFLVARPIKFLGVPLISSKLFYQDCTPLIHRITKRESSWTSIALAYSRRLQFIKSVVFSLQSFWSKHFILPKVIRSIQSTLCRFLWKGTSLAEFDA